VENSGPSERSNGSWSDEPSGAVGSAGPLPAVEIADGKHGRTF
jgi:hypothetical protein